MPLKARYEIDSAIGCFSLLPLSIQMCTLFVQTLAPYGIRSSTFSLLPRSTHNSIPLSLFLNMMYFIWLVVLIGFFHLKFQIANSSFVKFVSAISGT